MKNTLHLAVTVLFLLLSTLLYSQGEDPCSATELTVDTACNPITFSFDHTNTGSTADNGPSCGDYTAGDEDVWFYAIVPVSGVLSVTTETVGTLDDVSFYMMALVIRLQNFTVKT